MSDVAQADATQAAPSRTGSAGRSDKVELEGLGKFKLSQSSGKGNRYKDKFHALREKYDVVSAQHENHRRELEMANAKLRKIQAENDLLLDAMDIVAPTQPTLLQFLLPPPQRAPPPDDSREVNGYDHRVNHDHHLNGDTPLEHDAGRPEYASGREVNGRFA